jgi:parvulin-like peptidyl-prolyl isomerase
MPWTPAASLDGGSISMSDYNARLTLLRSLHEKSLFGDTGRPAPSPSSSAGRSDELRLEDQAITGLVDEALLHQEAERRHIAVTDAEVKQQTDAARRLFKSESDFEAALKDYGYTPDQLKAQLRARITEVKVENALAADRADRAVAALKTGTFADAVKKFSDLPGATGDGRLDLNPNAQSTIDPAIKPVIDALQPGQTTGAVRGANGYYILQLVARTSTDLQVNAIYVFAPDAAHYRTQDRPAWFVSFLSGLEKAAHVHYYVGTRAS